MPYTDDEFATIIQSAVTEATPAPPPHPVIWFAWGTILFLVIGILGYVLGWLLIHG